MAGLLPPGRARARPGRPASRQDQLDEARTFVQAELERQGYATGEEGPSGARSARRAACARATEQSADGSWHSPSSARATRRR